MSTTTALNNIECEVYFNCRCSFHHFWSIKVPTALVHQLDWANCKWSLMWFWMNMNDDWSLAAGAARVNHKKVSGSAVGGSGISSKQLQATPTWLPRTDLPPVRDLTFAQASHLQPVTSCDRLPPPGCSKLLLLTNLWYIFAPAHHSAWRWKSSKKKWYLSLSHWHGFPLNFCSAWAVSNKPSGFASDCRQSGRPKSTRRDDD